MRDEETGMRLPHLHVFHFVRRYSVPTRIFYSEDGELCWAWMERCRCGDERENWTGLRD